jgi:gamma-glutamyl:cysteine ligase YbdK (ATP-grasp superfamily)
VTRLSERYDAGEDIPSFHRILTSENKFLAARYGLEAPVMDLGTGRRNRIPISRLVRRTLAEVEPHARELTAPSASSTASGSSSGGVPARTASFGRSGRPATSRLSPARSPT